MDAGDGHITAEVVQAAQPSLIKAAWQRPAAFPWENRTVSQLPVNRLNHSTVCFDQASLLKHLDGASDKRCSEKELAACPAAAEEFEQGGEDLGGWGMSYLQQREKCSQKISQIWRNFIGIQNQHVYLQWQVGGGIDWMGFEKSYSIFKSSS